MNGSEMMAKQLAKALGLDLPKMVDDFGSLKNNVTATLSSIDGRLKRIEFMQGELWKKITTDPMPVQAQPTLPAQLPAAQQPQPNQQQ